VPSRGAGRRGGRPCWLEGQSPVSANQALALGNREHLGVHNQTLWSGAIEIKRITGN
jgi:hypothetical protein